MAFQTRGTTTPGTPSGIAGPLDDLVDQIAEAVRERLIQQGVPLQSGLQSEQQSVRQSRQPSGQSGHAGQNAQNAQSARSSAPSASVGSHWQHLVQEGADRLGHAAGESPFQPHVLQEDSALAAKIDHTLLKPEATLDEIKHVCEEARKYHFATVCVNSVYVGTVAELLRGSSTKAIAVVGFPLGAASTASKAFEARESIRVGAQEIDMVLNIGALKSRDYALVLEDIRAVVEASKPYGVKVILETSSLNEDQKVIGCALSKAAGAAFVKTSTGFASGGATADDIALMRRIVGPEMGVKASGGIRTYEDAAKMIAAGASRIGASASVAIVTKKAGAQGSGGKKTDDSSGKKPYKSSLY
jgi:deoxyribose-phosphate aldolase